MASEPYLSIVVPTFNEEKRIENTLLSILAFLRDQPYETELLIVDDGSTDQTCQVAANTIQDYPYQLLQNFKNLGKGAAVGKGMMAASGKFILFTDADLSTPIDEVARFLKHLEAGCDIVIGSRALPNSNVEVHQKILREGMGRIFNLFARLLAFRNIQDSQCGFKCFKREAAKELFSRQKLIGFSFDAEILFLAQRLGFRIYECPVTWRNSSASRVRLLRDPFLMFLDLLRIRWLHRHEAWRSKVHASR